ncbi:cysteinyl-tRNA synthetase [Desulfacinum hydrothermale DSM 13146]|uniref:Cysteine--tRNA ligase n=1 Tax=Desulfacinum hydrothermale DSM 13146 TaxID=1121390 RepID=A0A1W1XBQ0_9BACT|nr:cysteine synthase [Desulfacinum hydrothermale]SMC21293.1 cysteinyl-tRNA synthetase [Desulfacinum hydrothermale DSM 13146]
MKNVYDSVLELIGHTPLVRINKLNPNPKTTIYVKLEAKNPGGSIKDRPALSMIEAAEQSGELTPDKTIIEATSGNTGIGLAVVAAVKGYRLILAMPETASLERQKILKALGAELLLTPGALATDGAIEEVYRMVRENPDKYFLADQFNNPANPLAHYHGTGPEIYEQTDGRVNVVVTTLGTSGTAMGILRAMKERDPRIQVVAVEPYPGHKIQGLKNMKESYVPGIFDRYQLDRILHVKDEDAFEMARRLAKEEGIFVGMSSGAAMAAAAQIAAEREDGIIVAVLPDGGDRYLSTNLFTTLLEPDFQFFDFLRRKKVDFKPVQEGKVRIAVTGPRLDSGIEVEAARRFILADLLTRFLSVKGFQAEVFVLIPDLDSRSIQCAQHKGLDLDPYVEETVSRLSGQLRRLGITPSLRMSRTSEHLNAVVETTRTLLQKGMAYEKLRSVYFSLAGFTDYGTLSGIDPKKIRVGTTVDLDAYEKLNPRDFALLKRATLAELKRGDYLKTEWGNVLPTWHIAVAAAVLDQFGYPLDIHVSSMDFLFPHLENVRAIAEALTGKPYANTWLLAERVHLKASDDASTAGAAHLQALYEQGFTPAQIRFWLLSSHYRKPMNASLESLQSASRGLKRIREFIGRIQHSPSHGDRNPAVEEALFALEQGFFDALADDLNTPQALAALFQFIRQLNPLLDREPLHGEQKEQILASLRHIDQVLGLFRVELSPLSQEEKALLDRREEARKAKDWASADRIRDQLLERGIRVMDTPLGPRWERVETEDL